MTVKLYGHEEKPECFFDKLSDKLQKEILLKAYEFDQISGLYDRNDIYGCYERDRILTEIVESSGELISKDNGLNLLASVFNLLDTDGLRVLKQNAEISKCKAVVSLIKTIIEIVQKKDE